MRVPPNSGPSTAQGTTRKVNTGPTLSQVFSALRTIRPVAHNGFNLALLKQAKIAPETMDALLSLQRAGVREVHFFPTSIALLEHTFSSPALPGLTNSNGRQSREIHSQPLITFLTKRRYEVQGDETLLEGVFIGKSVGDKLVEWDKRITRPILRIATGTTREQVETAFLSTEFPDISFEKSALLIGYKKQQEQQAAPESTVNGIMAEQLQEALAARPQTIAKAVKAAFGKSLDGLASDLRGLASSIETLEGKDRKPVREALKGRLRANAAEIIRQVEEDSPKSAQKLTPLITLLKSLGTIRLGELLLAEAKEQGKLALFSLLNKQLIESAEPEEQALFYYLEGQLNEELGLSDEALECYRKAKELDNQKPYRAAIRRLKETEQAGQKAIRKEFEDLWQQIAEQQKRLLVRVGEDIFQAYRTEANPPKADAKFVFPGNTALWKALDKDAFEAARLAKDLIFPSAESVTSIAHWLLNQEEQLAVTVLEDVLISCTRAEERAAAYSVLYALQPLLEAKEVFIDLCESWLYTLLDNITHCIGNKKNILICEGFFLCLGIEAGFLFPDRMKALRFMHNLPLAAISGKAALGQLFVRPIVQRLITAPLNKMAEAGKQGGEIEAVFAAATEFAEAMPEEQGQRVLCTTHCDAAAILIQQGRHKQALVQIEAARKIDPDSWHIDKALCVYYLSQEERDQAIEHGEKALEKIQPSNQQEAAKVAMMLAHVYINRQSTAEDWQRGLELLSMAAEIRRFDAYAFGLAGSMLFTLKAVDLALDHVDKFIACFTRAQEHPYEENNAKYLIPMGLDFLEDLYPCFDMGNLRGHWNKIIEQIDKLESLAFAAIEEQQNLGDRGLLLVDLGRRLLLAGDLEKAEKILGLVIKFAKPESKASNYAKLSLAELLLSTERVQQVKPLVDELTPLKGDFDHTIKDGIFTEGVPMRASVFNLYGSFCLFCAPENDGEERNLLIKEALEAFDRAGQEGLSMATVLQQKALLYSTLENHPRALELWRKSIKADPDFITSHVNICHTLYTDLNDPSRAEEAITALASAILRMQGAKSSVLLDINVYKLIIGFYVSTYASPTLLTLLQQLHKSQSYQPFIWQALASLKKIPEELKNLTQ